MSDDERRRNSRKARVGEVDGDEVALARAERDSMRQGDEGTRQGFLRARIGVSIFIEGIRINWRGVLRRVLYFGDGRVSDLVLGPGAQRIGDMNAQRPNQTYTLTILDNETLVPWETVIGITRDKGFKAENRSWGE